MDDATGRTTAYSVGIALLLSCCNPLAAMSSGSRGSSDEVQTTTGVLPSGMDPGALSGPPSNFDAGPYLGLIERMWSGSSTFRRQCQRIAAERGLIVTLHGRVTTDPDPVVRASTSIERGGGVVTARIVVISPVDTVELIAHEVEHIIEHLDQIRLGDHVSAGNAQAGPKGFESRRAVEIGRRVAREVNDACRGGTCGGGGSQ